MISKGELSFLYRAMISMALHSRSSISVRSTSAPPESERRETSKVDGPYIYSTEQGSKDWCRAAASRSKKARSVSQIMNRIIALTTKADLGKRQIMVPLYSCGAAASRTKPLAASKNNRF